MPQLKPNYLRYRPHGIKSRQLRLSRQEAAQLINELKGKLVDTTEEDVLIGFGEDDGGCPVCNDFMQRERGGKKLVRDGIPDKIRRNGEVPVVDVASTDEQFLWYLFAKLAEEVEELRRATTRVGQLEELADVHQVLFSLRIILRLSQEAVNEAQATKFDARGGFEKRYLLVAAPTAVAKES